MNNKKMLAAIVPVIAISVIGAVLFTTVSPSFLLKQPSPPTLPQTASQQAQASSQNICKTDLSQLRVSYPIKQPTAKALPPNYRIQAIEELPSTAVIYYTDHQICPDTSINGQILQGAIVQMVGPIDFGNNSTEIQKKALDEYSKRSDIVAKVQAIEVNGYKGIGWEPYEGQAPTFINGTLAHTDSSMQPGRISWYNDNDKVAYSIWGTQPLDKLLEIARSIQP